MSEIKNILDNALFTVNTAREMNAELDQWPNVLLSGLTGSGKTSITKQWAEDNGILLASYDLSFNVTTVYVEDEGGILRPQRSEDPISVAKKLIFDTLIQYKDRGDFILFLDDYHRATRENLEAIYYTMDTHNIINPSTNEEIHLDNLLFTIAIKTTGI